MRKAFTLVELIIVVSILGILAAITLPSFQDHVTKAKESAARDTLQTLRKQITLYTVQHNNNPPGYLNGTFIPALLMMHLTYYTDLSGNVSQTKTDVFKYGPYMKLKQFPFNPLNNNNQIREVVDAEDFPVEPDGSTGWLYKPSTQEIRLNSPGTDSKGIDYYDY